MSDVQILVEMGFPQAKVEYALQITNNKGVEPAMEWLLAHADEEVPTGAAALSGGGAANSSGSTLGANTSGASGANTSGAGATTIPPVAKSLKCDTCNKVFADATEAEFHAVKTQHSNFSESNEEKTPMTDEEKKAQLVLIEEKLKKKRLEREEQEKAEALEREKSRIKSGKDMTEARRVLEEMEMKKIVEQRKREKAEEKAARERVRAQIEADKAARKAREQGNSAPPEPVSPVSPTTSNAAPKTPQKEYNETRIQVRLQNGSTLQETFNVKEQLSAVRLFIQLKTNAEGPFRLMTNFPRKIFTDDDYDKPLDVLGLVPSAVIIMTK